MKGKVAVIVCAVCAFGIGVGVGAAAAANVLSGIMEEYRKSADKNLSLFHLMCQWLRLRQEGKGIIPFFEKNNYRNIAIYGKGKLGEAVEKEMLNSNITVKYFIDQKADKASDGFVVSPNSELEAVDAIIVTPISSYGEIKQQLIKKANCPIISIEDVLYEV